MVTVFVVFLTAFIVLDYLTFYCFDRRTHTLVLLFILPLAFNFLLTRASLVDSHLLAHTLILLLISILLYFGKLLWKFVVQFLSFLIFMFSFFICFAFFFLYFLFDLLFLLHYLVSFLVIFYYPLMMYIVISLTSDFRIYISILFLLWWFCLSILVSFFYFLHCYYFPLSFCC